VIDRFRKRCRRRRQVRDARTQTARVGASRAKVERDVAEIREALRLPGTTPAQRTALGAELAKREQLLQDAGELYWDASLRGLA
jgi:hypothetical protein